MNKKNYALLAIVLLSGIAAGAVAQTTRKLTCAAWIAERSQGENRALQVENWLDGYLSGLSDGSGYNVVTTDPPSDYLWMDSYCRDHPLDSATDAGAFLINALSRKKHPYKHQY